MRKEPFEPLLEGVADFKGTSTVHKKVLALIGGVILPLSCLVLDPTVFKSGFIYHGEAPFLAWLQPFAYSFIILCSVALCMWLFGKIQNAKALATYAGVFATAMIGSLLLGLMMFPTSLLGLFLIIGALGFSPFLTSFVFLRAMRSTWRAARLGIGWRVAIGYFAGGMMATFLVPALFHFGFIRAMRTASPPSPTSQGNAAFYLAKSYTKVCGADFLASLYLRESNPARQEQWDALCMAMTGQHADEIHRSMDD